MVRPLRGLVSPPANLKDGVLTLSVSKMAVVELRPSGGHDRASVQQGVAMKRGKWNRKAHIAAGDVPGEGGPTPSAGLGAVAEKLLADARRSMTVPRSLSDPPMLCDQAMQRPVHWLLESDSIEVAAERMRDTNLGFFPVCNAANIAVGVVTDRDIVIRALATHLAPGTPVSEIMTREVVACRPKDPLLRAIGMMRERHLARVLCTDAVGRPIGVISLSEVARHEDEVRMAKTVRDIVIGSTSPSVA